MSEREAANLEATNNMSGRGKGKDYASGAGKGGAQRHKNRDNLQGAKGDIRRLARRAGVKRISRGMYKEVLNGRGESTTAIHSLQVQRTRWKRVQESAADSLCPMRREKMSSDSCSPCRKRPKIGEEMLPSNELEAMSESDPDWMSDTECSPEEDEGSLECLVEDMPGSEPDGVSDTEHSPELEHFARHGRGGMVNERQDGVRGKSEGARTARTLQPLERCKEALMSLHQARRWKIGLREIESLAEGRVFLSCSVKEALTRLAKQWRGCGRGPSVAREEAPSPGDVLFANAVRFEIDALSAGDRTEEEMKEIVENMVSEEHWYRGRMENLSAFLRAREVFHHFPLC